VKCVTLTKEAVEGCRKPLGKKVCRGTKRSVENPGKKNYFFGNKKTLLETLLK
jgi:hypothetical protein